jgi:hypothetical protein
VADLPVEATIAMADVPGPIREGLMAFCCGAGLKVSQIKSVACGGCLAGRPPRSPSVWRAGTMSSPETGGSGLTDDGNVERLPVCP